MSRNKPFVTIKYAQTLDGKIADQKGQSRWISGREARKFAHQLRAEHQAILVGVNTVIKDDPLLTVRLVKGKNPLRIILDSRLRTPPGSRIIKGAGKVPIIIATTARAPKRKIKLFQKRGIRIIVVPGGKAGGLDLTKLLIFLGKLKIKTLLVEGGSKIITSFLKKKLVGRLIVVIAPRILGKGLAAIGDLEISGINKSLKFKLEEVKKTGKDLIIVNKVVRR